MTAVASPDASAGAIWHLTRCSRVLIIVTETELDKDEP